MAEFISVNSAINSALILPNSAIKYIDLFNLKAI